MIALLGSRDRDPSGSLVTQPSRQVQSKQVFFPRLVTGKQVSVEDAHGQPCCREYEAQGA